MDIRIEKTFLGTDYSVWIDGKEGRPNFWVDPQYEKIISDDETATPPKGLIEMVREFALKPVIPKKRNIDAEIAADIEYEKHYNSIKNAMAE